MSETNRVGLYYSLEASEGKLVASPTFTQIGYTGSPGLGGEISSITSEEIRSDRQITDLIVTGKEVSGSVNVELATDVYDDFIASGLYSSWQRKGLFVASDITAITTDVVSFDDGSAFTVGDLALFEGGGANVDGVRLVSTVNSDDITFVGLNTSSVPADVKVRIVGFQSDSQIAVDTSAKTVAITGFSKAFRKGEWIGVNNGRSSDKNGFYRVVSHSASGGITTVVYDNSFEVDLPADLTRGETPVLTAPASGKSVLMLGDYIVNGVEKKPMSLLQRFESHDPVTVYRSLGMSVGTMTVNFEAQSVVTASFDVQGLDNIEDNTNYSTVAQTETKKFSTGSDVQAVLLKGSRVTSPNIVQSATISINNNLRPQTGVGFIGAASQAAGVCEVTGSISVYFGTKDVYQDLVENRETSFFTAFYDRQEKRMLAFDVPRMFFSSGIPDVPAGNQDIVLSMEYAGVKTSDAVGGYQVMCQQFFYL